MIHTIPSRNWTTALADTFEQCKNGDTIIVHTDAMQELAQRAHVRMCQDKEVIFAVKQPEELKRWQNQQKPRSKESPQ